MATSQHAATTRPAPTRGRLVLAVLCVAPFVLVLDTTIVTVALPSIGRDLGVSPATLHWVLAQLRPRLRRPAPEWGAPG